ncbi:MAG: Holliday junction branch migration protein RuvA [Nitrospirae bacterium CG_4_10_14_0_8_um_filter_41_23]|nr:Holliday junction branch migration protein RuvA [Nitrospirota bacterium]OIP59256.1 MAG: Holliday junction DNA helicase RuvA [Nitrospirae bacterium CG2_30_41_42]PIQ94330.1 MAG: Holliday junction branch migration protein RuvA [Nitrospirae bacterium CG11_big_fil_rev_8_21_14_0_20_41_14]PIV44165.1 MAG: Holliday junction branch migration protein RuvA [Nitrospirae bacterium CG02_land_8_20_14_3_00_41_53]PIW87292.1 MAG: Holliday junction branch migration protein RuvA [Nitrospirae bacterium CG_4_8_14_
MIGSLRGKLIYKKSDNLIVEVSGVGYRVNVTFNTISILPEEGKDVFLHIYTHVRKDILQLYGFTSEDEKKIFITLLGITGIGPKMALNILSGISHNDLLQAIETEDVAQLCRIPGLGKKTAQRLILELREKLPPAKETVDRVFEDTLSALVNLGYKKSIALESLEKAYKKGYHDIEGLLKEALKYLNRDSQRTGDVK